MRIGKGRTKLVISRKGFHLHIEIKKYTQLCLIKGDGCGGGYYTRTHLFCRPLMRFKKPHTTVSVVDGRTIRETSYKWW